MLQIHLASPLAVLWRFSLLLVIEDINGLYCEKEHSTLIYYNLFGA